MIRRIGIDVGGVIIDSLTNDNTDTSFCRGDFLRTTAVIDSFTAIRQIVSRYGSENVFIVSKCGAVIENKTRLWLNHTGFYAQTGFCSENLHFCLNRAGKAPIAQRLGLTDFIDDKEEVLGYMQGIVDRRYLFGPQHHPLKNPSDLIVVANWAAVLSELP